MKQQEIIKKIGAIIKELQEQQQYIEQTKGVINDLELELFVANGHFLSDHIEILRKINGQLAKTQAEKKSSPIREKFFEPVVQPAPAPTTSKKEQPPAEYATFELTNEPIEHLKEPEPVKEEPTKQEEPVIAEPVKEEPIIVEWTKEETVSEEEPVIEEPVKEEEPVTEEPLFKYEEPVIRHELVLDEIPDISDEEVELPGFDDMDRADDEYVHHPEPEHHFIVPEFTPTEVEPVANFDEPEPEIPAYAASEPETPSYTEPEPEPYRSWTPPLEAEKPPTVYEVITGNFAAPNRLADSLPAIKDIKSAINLNDKMLYVRELFHGYSLSYSEAIEILNRCTSFEEADQFLKTNYAQKNDWEDKPATVEKFYGVLRRRFA